MSPFSSPPVYPARLEKAKTDADLVFVCDHASNHFPPEFGTLGLTAAQQSAHIAWDPGALGLARGLLQRLGGVLAAAQVSRLIYDCNRPPDAPGAMATQSEIHAVPGNLGLTPADRLARVRAVYLPFHDTLRAEITRRIAVGRPPVIVTVHSFSPVWHGVSRTVEFGVIHDDDPALALAVLAAAQAMTPLQSALNQPYSARDGVTHTLRLQALPNRLANVMLEVRNDLIAEPQDQDRMAEVLAPVLAAALTAIDRDDPAPGQE